MGLLASAYPGLASLAVAIGVIVAIGAAVAGNGVRRVLGPLFVAGTIAAWFWMQAQTAERELKALVDFEAACREARSEWLRPVSGVTELFVEQGSSDVAWQAQIPRIGNQIASPLLRETPRFARVAVSVKASGSTVAEYRYAPPDALYLLGVDSMTQVEQLPRYGLRWRADPMRTDGLQPYRMEIFDRTTGDVLGRQLNFKFVEPGSGRARLCPVTDPADLVRSLLLTGARS